MVIIPESELNVSFSRASGKGGQNVNKVETRVTVRWNIYDSKFLMLEQKNILLAKLKNKLNVDNELVVSCDEERDQYRNREKAVWKINQIVSKTLEKTKVRKKTKPTRSSQEKRLEEKKQRSILKKSRKILD